MDLTSAADSLYGLPREEFTSARAELAKQARASGDRELATAIGRLRRPTVAAWLVNQLVRQRPDRLRELEGLGERLRAAHERLDGAALRELTGQRRELLAELTRVVRDIGTSGGVNVSDSATRELEEMFTAALADPDAAEALGSGRLSSAKSLTESEGDWPATATTSRPRPTLVRAPEDTSVDEPGDEPSADRTAPDRRRPPAAAATSSATRGQPPDAETPGDAPEKAHSDAPDGAAARRAEAVRRARAEADRLNEALAEAQRRHEQAANDYDRATSEESAAHQNVATRRAELIAAEQAEQQARQRTRFARRASQDAERELAHAQRLADRAHQRLAALHAP